MDSEYFPLCRDLLYLTFALAGVMAGSALHLPRRDLRGKARNWIILWLFCAFSGIFVCFSLVLIHSRGSLDFMPPLAPFLGAAVVVFALAARFPRGFAFPLILLGGLAVVWLGYSFLHFPRIRSEGTPLFLVIHNKGESGRLRFIGPGDRECVDRTYIFNIEEGEALPELRGILMTLDPSYPLFGGETRGIITEIRCDGEVPFFPEGRFLPKWYASLFSGGQSGISRSWGISAQKFQEDLGPGSLPPGTNLILRFDGINITRDFSPGASVFSMLR
ncbi:MAG: hypothetical protein LBT95_08855 [Treponema sp.]|jgi:hypothetical protein|nr:hypothetical protein [Treponema sp.]